MNNGKFSVNSKAGKLASWTVDRAIGVKSILMSISFSG